MAVCLTDHVFTNPYIPWPFLPYISMNNLWGTIDLYSFVGIRSGCYGESPTSMFCNSNEDRNGGGTFHHN
ncbi:MAG: hypothetical protein R2788_24330 [Saprospiraceae bacterium]